MSTANPNAGSATGRRSETPRRQQERASASGRRRAPSPLSNARMSRTGEKEEMITLNNRLANLFEELRRKEIENDGLRETVRTMEESREREETVIRKNYEDEMNALRRSLDNQANSAARSAVERDSLRSENQELRAKLADLERQVARLGKDLESLEMVNGDLNNKLSAAKRAEEELKSLKVDFGKTSKALEDAKRNLQDETVRRIEAENQLQTMREKLDYDEQVMEQRISEIRMQKSMEVTEVDHRLNEEYEAKMKEHLDQLRADFQSKQQQLREEMSHRMEMKDRENDRLREEMSSLQKDYENILEVNISLDAEIQVYRKLVEGAEARLNLSQDETDSPRRKRGRTEYEVDDIEIVCTGTSTGDVQISDVDLKSGKVIEILNKGKDEDVAIGGWKLAHSVDGENEVVVYKFHRNVLLKPEASIRVYSSDAGFVHDPTHEMFPGGGRPFFFFCGVSKRAMAFREECCSAWFCLNLGLALPVACGT
ncbi:unnamed protein product [Cyprideis torosa]|uniref:Uncharacterized protein n=1 Tax=Cyprideis torosa TaxID=163714 RepID=A0A7R8W9U0_9CRUS|nr:unnamed protein product [Cyprideis torosa]CAG0887668.1 unnamed protein product [Cyprideis torosa]